MRKAWSELRSLLKHKSKKTRNMMLFLAIFIVIIILIIETIGLLGSLFLQSGSVYQTDSDITTAIISFFKWVVASGATITCVKTIKGSTNSDDYEGDLGLDEDIPDDGDEETHDGTPEG